MKIADHLADYGHLERLIELISQADLGISGIDIENEKYVANSTQRFLQYLTGKDNSLSKPLPDEIQYRKRFRFLHSMSEGDIRKLDYKSESKGTRTLISLLVPALEALSRGSLLVVDELDTSLHPNLARAFVSLFSKESSNPRGAQLVFSTHDVTLLGGGVVRQDEIWMTDKNREGASEFTPLTDFKLRSRDDIEKAYRGGRLGGVPAADDFPVAFDDDRLPAAEQ